MYCGHCAAPLPEAAQFCQSCGYRVIHPDDPEAARFLAEQARADAARTPAPTRPPAPAATPPGPVPAPTPSPRRRPTPTPPPATPAPPAPERVDQPRALKVRTADPTTYEDLDEEWDDEPASWRQDRRILAALLAAAAVLLILLVYVLFGRGDDTPTPAASPTKSSAAASPSASVKPSSTPKATAVKLPAGAEKCAEATAALPYTTYRGSSVTTCRFADKVREEYVAAGAPKGEFKAKSPVTGRTYDMVCTGSPLLTCKGGSNAVVYLVKK